MSDFINQLNDFSCIHREEDLRLSKLYHYTNCPQVVGNIAAGCFRATYIADFKNEDRQEGRLILEQVLDVVRETAGERPELFDECKRLIGTQQSIDEFISRHMTYVLSMSKDYDSKYLWDHYARDNLPIISAQFCASQDVKIRFLWRFWCPKMSRILKLHLLQATSM